MNDEQINLSPAEANKMRRNISALQKSIRDMHALRDKINTALSRVHAENLDLALTQKKNLKLLSSQYDKLSQQVACLPPLDAAQVLEDEYNYILTIGNIIETTRELKKPVDIGEENRAAIIDGLVKFYDGLRQELASSKAAQA